ncbi:hypothetical protein [Paraliomyxa miuraensis]|uniref:hypothetical protein n=1 Tax=Paraliomyxa miuraensis TaxID=376150 RepID=UPI00224FD417|nr:hypothetical protein [Paraliomyxa miuraensis]MCX4240419.1 hypothetical protein [Paraliomyxa miuraensis]
MSTARGWVNGRRMLVRASAVAWLVVLCGCRGGESSSRYVEADAEARDEPVATPEVEAKAETKVEPVAAPKVEAKARAQDESVATPEVEAKAEAKVEPPDLADTKVFSRTRVRVAGRAVKVWTDEQEQPPAPTEDTDEGYVPPKVSLVVSIDGATTGEGLITFSTAFDYCDVTEAVVEPVAGEPSPLVFAQAFCAMGEDEFSRDMLSTVIHVGGPTTAPRVLWQGTGSFSSSFGVCRYIDVPAARVPKPGTVLIQQITEVTFDPDPHLRNIRCKPKKERVRKLAEITF